LSWENHPTSSCLTPQRGNANEQRMDPWARRPTGEFSHNRNPTGGYESLASLYGNGFSLGTEERYAFYLGARCPCLWRCSPCRESRAMDYRVGRGGRSCREPEGNAPGGNRNVENAPRCSHLSCPATSPSWTYLLLQFNRRDLRRMRKRRDHRSDPARSHLCLRRSKVRAGTVAHDVG